MITVNNISASLEILQRVYRSTYRDFRNTPPNERMYYLLFQTMQDLRRMIIKLNNSIKQLVGGGLTSLVEELVILRKRCVSSVNLVRKKPEFTPSTKHLQAKPTRLAHKYTQHKIQHRK